jgi:hypothetical protein
VWGFSAEEVLENLQLVWDGIAAGGEIENLKKALLKCRGQNKMDCSMEIYNAKR